MTTHQNAAPSWWKAACEALSAQDEILGKLINEYPGSHLKKTTSDPFPVLANSIIGQQISVQAADSIRTKLLTQTALSVSAIIHNELALINVGLSKQKAAYIRNIAEWFHHNDINDQWFKDTPTEQIQAELIGIKGIGNWTWEMFAIFHLQAPNILPLADVGVLKGIEKHYRISRKAILANKAFWTAKWAPYATVATWFLWRSLDPVEVVY